MLLNFVDTKKSRIRETLNLSTDGDQTDRQTHIHTDGHGDSMTESAQWVDSVKLPI